MAVISYLTRILFDFGVLAELRTELATLGIRKPLLVTDRGVVAAGLAERALQAMGAGIEATVYQDTPANPTEAAVKQATALYREARCDGLVAIGGGSSMDLAKAVAIIATHDGPLRSYAAVEGGMPRITAAVAPLIAIPTTAGTGSEVGRGAVIVFDDGRKLGLLSPHLLPKVALCDPELTLDLPAPITAATGMDAVAHCIETYLSPLVNPPAEAIACDGLGRAIAHIERAVADGHDREARWNMMMASMEGAMAFQKGLGAVHAMSHPLGGLPDLKLHHGTLNAVVMPAVLRFNAGHVGRKYEHLHAVMGLAPGVDLADAIAALNARLGLPANLAEMGVPRQVIPAMAVLAEQDHTNQTNPRPAKAEDYETLFAEAMG
ncbi:iron-containing alcohol dehydrogenase [Oceanibacterium hippocampi]|uniref:NAD-dependent methanol dehydrogenase n=1 Tax=Oceanibacterium hippocampi TaxID=745714 RepID=A0A1Y5SB03_9PROT|nr:iron-containing alcohol dehydrogenase [Oceanibacterium hippocampi]SLN35437.1 NAD-dependent methanol dehydrogenase [Oceanibacterium hippocampi]